MFIGMHDIDLRFAYAFQTIAISCYYDFRMNLRCFHFDVNASVLGFSYDYLNIV